MDSAHHYSSRICSLFALIGMAFAENTNVFTIANVAVFGFVFVEILIQACLSLSSQQKRKRYVVFTQYQTKRLLSVPILLSLVDSTPWRSLGSCGVQKRENLSDTARYHVSRYCLFIFASFEALREGSCSMHCLTIRSFRNGR